LVDRRDDHPEPVFRLPCLPATEADLKAKILLGIRIVRLAVIRANARSRADELADQWRRDRVHRDPLGEENHAFAETARPFVEVERCRSAGIAISSLSNFDLRA